MRKLLTVWIVLAAIVGASVPASAQLMMRGAGCAHASCSGGGSPTLTAANQNSVNGAAGTTLTIPLTLGGSDTALLVGIEEYLGTGVTVSSVTIGGGPTNLSLLDSQNFSASRTELWGLASPPTGAQTITINFSGIGAAASAGAASFAGANAASRRKAQPA